MLPPTTAGQDAIATTDTAALLAEIERLRLDRALLFEELSQRDDEIERLRATLGLAEVERDALLAAASLAEIPL